MFNGSTHSSSEEDAPDSLIKSVNLSINDTPESFPKKTSHPISYGAIYRSLKLLGAKADQYWESSKPKIGLCSNLFGTLGDTAGWCILFSGKSSTDSKFPDDLIIAAAIFVAVVTICETLSEYATNQNHNSLHESTSPQQHTGENTPLNGSRKNNCNGRTVLAMGVAGGAWIGYSTGATVAAILALDKEVEKSWPTSAVIAMNVGLIALGFITTVADIRLKYKNLIYYGCYVNCQ